MPEIRLLHVVASCLAAISMSACTTVGSDDRWLEPGQYAVAHDSEVKLKVPDSNRELVVQVAWPTTDGPFPVVVFSHGAFCYPQQYSRITDFWVSHGYVVILPNHLDSPNRGKIRPAELSQMQDTRVEDMSVVLDSLADIEQQIPELAGRIATDKAAVAGHSFGGMIAMVKTGLRMQNAAGEVMTGYSDQRFSAAVVMSGVGQVPPMPNLPDVPYMTDDAFSGLTRPLIASGGSLDSGNVGTGIVYPWEWRMSAYTLAPPGDKFAVTLENADHYLGGLICRDNRGGPADPIAVETVRAAQTAFLDAYMKDDKTALRWLQSGNVQTLAADRAKLEYK